MNLKHDVLPPDPSQPPRVLTSDGRVYLARLGFSFYFFTAFVSSLLMCDCGPIPGLIMMACSLLPLIFGSRLLQIAAVFCLIIAIAVAFIGYRQTTASQERAERAQQMQEQRLNAR